MDYSVQRFVTGPIETNTYVVSTRFENKEHCIIIDPSLGCESVISYIEQRKFMVASLLLTHGHFDHMLGIDEIIQHYPSCAIWLHPDEQVLVQNATYNGSAIIGMNYRFLRPFQPLAEGKMDIGGFTITVFHVPGHTPGGCCLLLGHHCFSGDSLFADSIGRCDFALSDQELLIQGIREKLLPLPDDTIVYPGHGGRTTIGRERRCNPFLS
ncbi:MAG: MBL fold metallo-hydrolase [Chitinivibrionales bacterium]|nr:MBL fold metallo-hydrolase [Chitinivibrionales bacterium]